MGKLAKCRTTKKKMDNNQVKTTLDVKERTFAIAKKGERKTILRSGYLGPCVAFYGINAHKGVAFMSHVDGNIYGMKRMVEQLELEADGDLKGFSLYLTTNYTLAVRVIGLACIIAFIIIWWLLNDVSALVLTTAVLAFWLYFFFSSIVQIYCLARIRFKTWNVVPDTPLQFCGRVEVSVDVFSTNGPSKAHREALPEKESKPLYEPMTEHVWWQGMKPMPKD